MEDNSSTDTDRDTARWISGKKLCPLARDPLRACHCYDMNSQKIPAAMYYCGGKFEECVIYQRIIATKYCLLT
jgi:hypothetical protein